MSRSFPHFLQEFNITELGRGIWWAEKESLPYLEGLEIQQQAIDWVSRNTHEIIFISCSHPSCFTVGRGLQRKTDAETLVDFDPSLINRLHLPVYEVKRGGGITFHHPGQWVCYPILSLAQNRLDIYKVMKILLDLAKYSLEHHWGISDLAYNKKLLGLWWQDRKLASIGMASSHYITYHGIALNLWWDSIMKKELNLVYPCGLPSYTYISVQDILGKIAPMHSEAFFIQVREDFRHNISHYFPQSRLEL